MNISKTRKGTLLFLTDSLNTPLLSSSGFTPFGYYLTAPHKSGFNAHPIEPPYGLYIIGSYRSYHPALGRFCAPDTISPFAPNAMNAYSYCSSEPVNRMDPDGHLWGWPLSKFKLFYKSSEHYSKKMKDLNRMIETRRTDAIAKLRQPAHDQYAYTLKHVKRQLGDDDPVFKTVANMPGLDGVITEQFRADFRRNYEPLLAEIQKLSRKKDSYQKKFDASRTQETRRKQATR